VLDRPPATGAAKAGLDLIGDEEDPVLVAQLAEALQEGSGRREVAALTLDRFDDDCRHIRRGDLPAEDRPAQVLELGGAVAAGVLAPRADPRERSVVNHRQKRTETGALLDLRIGQAQGPERAAVEAALEGDDPGPMRVVAGELDGALDRLGPRVCQEHPSLLREGRDPGQALHELEVARLVEVGRRDVDQPLRLLADGGDDLRVRVPGRAHGDAGREVEEPVAVDVGHDHPAAGLGNQRIRPRQ
jgi:hypothetical protein